ncbi:MAG: hypothetical protein ABR584_09720 [Candidatus Baltobacteraceae bacterium]
MKDINAIASYPNAPLHEWNPSFPEGRIDCLYLHWSAHSYQAVFPAYHFCIAMRQDGTRVVVQTNRIEANMRDVRSDPDEPYAAHTRGRNSHAIGLSIMGMEGATPQDFGPYPLTEPLIEGLCLVAARLAAFYRVPVDAEHILTHAEAGAAEGYFGTGPQERWDIARLVPAPEDLRLAEAAQTGDELRRRIVLARPGSP